MSQSHDSYDTSWSNDPYMHIAYSLSDFVIDSLNNENSQFTFKTMKIHNSHSKQLSIIQESKIKN